MPQTFKLTENHIKLLSNAYVGWEDIEFGAPAINGKRPYGNSDVVRDMISILFGEDLPDSTQAALEDYVRQLHNETETALQIILCTQSFIPGTYEKTNPYNDRAWKLVKENK